MNHSSATSIPVVSVIVITYNQEHCIDRALSGILHQKGAFRLEVIVANDASTDSTLNHVKRWQRRYPDNVVIIDHPENVGFRANYLSAFRKATGKYLCMCDADDYWTDARKIERQMGYMESHLDCAITFHRVVNLYRPSGIKTLSNGNQPAEADFVALSNRNFITNLSVMYRRELVPAEALPEWLAEVSLPDYAYHMLYAAHGSIHYFSRPMGAYIQSSSGAWSLQTQSQRQRMALDVRMRLLRHFGADSPAAPGLRHSSLQILLTLLNLARAENNPEECARVIKEIQELYPEKSIEEIESEAGKTAVNAARAKRTSLRSLLKKTYRQLTRLLPAPRVC